MRMYVYFPSMYLVLIHLTLTSCPCKFYFLSCYFFNALCYLSVYLTCRSHSPLTNYYKFLQPPLSKLSSLPNYPQIVVKLIGADQLVVEPKTKDQVVVDEPEGDNPGMNFADDLFEGGCE